MCTLRVSFLSSLHGKPGPRRVDLELEDVRSPLDSSGLAERDPSILCRDIFISV